MPLLALPNELILMLVPHLDKKGYHSLVHASHRLYTLLSHGLQQRVRRYKRTCEATNLHWAAEVDDGILGRCLLSRSHEKKHASDLQPGRTPLSIAVSNGNPKITKVLLEHGADPTGYNATPFCTANLLVEAAVRSRNAEVVRLVLDATIAKGESPGGLAMHAAVCVGNLEILDMVWQR